MKKTILVVDDDMQVRKLFLDMLTKKGYRVIMASGGEEAVEYCLREKPDLVLLDINMPGMDGIDTLRKIKANDLSTKVVMLTGHEQSVLENQARLSGALGFLSKSLDMKAIMDIIDDTLAGGNKPHASAFGKSILIVDDEDQIRALLSDFLKKKGYAPQTAADGSEAIKKVLEFKPSVILLDIRMPGMSGLDTLKKIREIDQKVSVIMITAVDDQAAAESAMRLGAYDYLLKPIDLGYLGLCLLTNFCLSEN